MGKRPAEYAMILIGLVGLVMVGWAGVLLGFAVVLGVGFLVIPAGIYALAGATFLATTGVVLGLDLVATLIGRREVPR